MNNSTRTGEEALSRRLWNTPDKIGENSKRSADSQVVLIVYSTLTSAPYPALDPSPRLRRPWLACSMSPLPLTLALTWTLKWYWQTLIQNSHWWVLPSYHTIWKLSSRACWSWPSYRWDHLKSSKSSQSVPVSRSTSGSSNMGSASSASWASAAVWRAL